MSQLRWTHDSLWTFSVIKHGSSTSLSWAHWRLGYLKTRSVLLLERSTGFDHPFSQTPLFKDNALSSSWAMSFLWISSEWKWEWSPAFGHVCPHIPYKGPKERTQLRLGIFIWAASEVGAPSLCRFASYSLLNWAVGGIIPRLSYQGFTWPPLVRQ